MDIYTPTPTSATGRRIPAGLPGRPRQRVPRQLRNRAQRVLPESGARPRRQRRVDTKRHSSCGDEPGAACWRLHRAGEGESAPGRGVRGLAGRALHAFVVGWNTALVPAGQAPAASPTGQPEMEGQNRLELGDGTGTRMHSYLPSGASTATPRADRIFPGSRPTPRSPRGTRCRVNALRRPVRHASSVYSHTVDKAAPAAPQWPGARRAAGGAAANGSR